MLAQKNTVEEEDVDETLDDVAVDDVLEAVPVVVVELRVKLLDEEVLV